jgi:hypothetical protein
LSYLKTTSHCNEVGCLCLILIYERAEIVPKALDFDVNDKIIIDMISSDLQLQTIKP